MLRGSCGGNGTKAMMLNRTKQEGWDKMRMTIVDIMFYQAENEILIFKLFLALKEVKYFEFLYLENNI